MKLRLGYLYPDLMNIYADRGNVECLRRRCAWRGIELEVVRLGVRADFDPSQIDIMFIGGGQDRQQAAVSQDLRGDAGLRVRKAVDQGAVLLAVCGGYQLMGRRYLAADGTELPGLGLIDLETRHPGAREPRCIGDVAVEWRGQTLVGFENHGGRTYLGDGAQPLARVLLGNGNNSEDGTEGAQFGNVFGTYLHGSLLPKNPHFADFLIGLALRRREPGRSLDPLPDAAEWAAHNSALAKVGLPPRTSN